MNLTTNQQKFVTEATEALQHEGMYSLCGFAGTGKTTTLKALYELLPNIKFLTPTHKAKSVLKSKLGPLAEVSTTTGFVKSFKGTKLEQIDDRISMAHSPTECIIQLTKRKDASNNTGLQQALGYLIKLLENPKCLKNFKKERKALIKSGEAQQPVFAEYIEREDDDFMIVVVDESSMVTRRDRDLINQKADAVLYVGDGFQLPPPSREDDQDWFAHRKHDWYLTEIMRQKKESGILQLANALRNADSVFNLHRWIEKNRKDYNDIFLANYCDEMLERLDDEDWVALSFMNDNVDAMCYDTRRVLGRDRNIVTPDDRLFCANNFGDFSNKDEIELFKDLTINTNDSVFGFGCRPVRLNNITKELEGSPVFNDARLIADITNKERKERLSNRGLLARFDYARTVHASQGSEWQNVIYQHEGVDFLDDEVQNRLVYTAVTRAVDKFILLK